MAIAGGHICLVSTTLSDQDITVSDDASALIPFPHHRAEDVPRPDETGWPPSFLQASLFTSVVSFGAAGGVRDYRIGFPCEFPLSPWPAGWAWCC